MSSALAGDQPPSFALVRCIPFTLIDSLGRRECDRSGRFASGRRRLPTDATNIHPAVPATGQSVEAARADQARGQVIDIAVEPRRAGKASGLEERDAAASATRHLDVKTVKRCVGAGLDRPVSHSRSRRGSVGISTATYATENNGYEFEAFGTSETVIFKGMANPARQTSAR